MVEVAKSGLLSAAVGAAGMAYNNWGDSHAGNLYRFGKDTGLNQMITTQAKAAGNSVFESAKMQLDTLQKQHNSLGSVKRKLDFTKGGQKQLTNHAGTSRKTKKAPSSRSTLPRQHSFAARGGRSQAKYTRPLAFKKKWAAPVRRKRKRRSKFGF